jgi:hypothetical protein
MFDSSKSELLYFTYKYKINAYTLLGVMSGMYVIHATMGSVRWLGVYFDYKLHFRHYAQVQAKKAL